MPDYPLPDDRIAELEMLHSKAPSDTVERTWEFNGESSVEIEVKDMEAAAFYQAAREYVPYLIEEVRRCRKDHARNATPTSSSRPRRKARSPR